jgi:hypothetical protein
MRISVIMPVCAYPRPEEKLGRPHPQLRRALDSILVGGHPDFEILVGIDGERPRIRAALASWQRAHPEVRMLVRAFPFRVPRRYGNTQRNELIPLASGDYLHFNDHDDRYVEGALGRIAEVARRHPGRPIVGRMRIWCWGREKRLLDPPDYLWKTKGRVEKGHVGGHMLVAPNRPDLLGRFVPEHTYEADFTFVSQTLEAFRRVGLGEIWVEDFFAECRPWMRRE